MSAEKVPGKTEDGGACPKCHCPDTLIIIVKRGRKVIRRRRVCQNVNCSAAFWTLERLEDAEPPKGA
jgi:transcriptional regulator NrdR family protein